MWEDSIVFILNFASLAIEVFISLSCKSHGFGEKEEANGAKNGSSITFGKADNGSCRGSNRGYSLQFWIARLDFISLVSECSLDFNAMMTIN